jgi:hypothetical protein
VRWWYNTEIRSRDGSPAADVPTPGGFLEGPQVIPLPTGQSGNLSLYSPSLVSTQAVRAIHSATVVIDVKRAEGVPLKSVIDYATLVGLAEIKLGASPGNSILSLFRSDGHNRLTRRDRAFLTGLYRIAMDRRAEQQRRALVGAIAGRTTSE